MFSSQNQSVILLKSVKSDGGIKYIENCYEYGFIVERPPDTKDMRDKSLEYTCCDNNHL